MGRMEWLLCHSWLMGAGLRDVEGYKLGICFECSSSFSMGV